MDFVCATLFHSNVNKVSPNRTILAGEKVGIAWLLPNEPGVYWYVFFPQLFCGYDLCRFEHAYIALHAKPSFVKSTLLWRPSSQSCALIPGADVLHRQPQKSQWGSTRALQTHPCASDCKTRALVIRSEQMCCCPLKPGLSRMIYRQQQQQQQQSGMFSALTVFRSSLVWTLTLLNSNVNLRVTM